MESPSSDELVPDEWPLRNLIADYEFDCSVRMHNFNQWNISLDQYNKEISELKYAYERDLKNFYLQSQEMLRNSRESRQKCSNENLILFDRLWFAVDSSSFKKLTTAKDLKERCELCKYSEVCDKKALFQALMQWEDRTLLDHTNQSLN